MPSKLITIVKVFLLLFCSYHHCRWRNKNLPRKLICREKNWEDKVRDPYDMRELLELLFILLCGPWDNRILCGMFLYKISTSLPFPTIHTTPLWATLIRLLILTMENVWLIYKSILKKVSPPFHPKCTCTAKEGQYID